MNDQLNHINSKIKQVDEREKSRSKEFEEVKKRVEDLESLDKIKTQGFMHSDKSWASVVQVAESRVVSAPLNRPIEQIEIINSVSIEQKERDKKRKNVIIFGLQESTKSVQRDQESEDKNATCEIFRDLNIDTRKISFIRRFRSKNGQSRPAPVLVQLNRSEDKAEVLSAAKNLRKSAKFSHVFINPDLTEAERVLGRQLRVQRNKLNEAEEGQSSDIRWAIRGSNFVKYSINESQEKSQSGYYRQQQPHSSMSH